MCASFVFCINVCNVMDLMMREWIKARTGMAVDSGNFCKSCQLAKLNLFLFIIECIYNYIQPNSELKSSLAIRVFNS